MPGFASRRAAIAASQNDQLPDLHPISEAGGPDFILVTHAHTDHTGALPLVVEQYPHVPVLATRPTVELVRILQADAQRIMQSKQEQEGELPLFDEIAAERLMSTFQTVEFRQPVRLGENLQVTFHPAGHIAGAAMLVLESDEGVLVMSGDLSLSAQRAVGQRGAAEYQSRCAGPGKHVWRETARQPCRGRKTADRYAAPDHGGGR